MKHRCPSCGHGNRPDCRFCTECGSHLGPNCATCGAAVEPRENFCGSCGTALREQEAVPGHADAPLPAPDAATGERSELTVLCDLVGSTDLAAHFDPEDWRAVVQAYQQRAARIVARFGGHVGRYLGDRLLEELG